MKKTVGYLLILVLVLGIFVSHIPVASATEFRDDLRAARDLSKAENYSTDYTLTGDGPTDMIAVAFAQLGKSGETLGYTDNWCTNFIGDCAILAGQSSAIPMTMDFRTLENYILTAGGYEVSVEDAKPGDLCLYKNYAYFANHIEMIYEVDGTNISTIGGNSPRGGSSATVGSFPINTVANYESASNIYKILRPNYVTHTNLPINVTSDRPSYYYGTEVRVTWSSTVNEESYQIDMYCDDRLVISQNLGDVNAYTFAAMETGNYTVYITSIRGEEAVRSAPCTFTVVYEAPAIRLSAYNRDVKATWSDVAAESYFVSLYDADTKEVLYEENLGKTFSWKQVLGLGNYTFSVKAVYSNGVTMEGTFDFSRNRYIAMTNKGPYATFAPGEEIILSVDAEEGYAVSYTIYFTPEGGKRKQVTSVRKYSGKLFTHTYTATEPGTYDCIIRVETSYGYMDSEPVVWYVAEDCTHNYTAETVAPTCTQPGSTTYTCALCGDSYTESIAAMGHDYVGKTTAVPTCTEEGTTTYTCSRCGHGYTEPIPAMGHQAVIDAAIAPTCLNSGMTEGMHCERCHTVLVAQEIMPRLGHDYQYTDRNDGTHIGACNRCNKTRTEGHKFSAGTCICGAEEEKTPLQEPTWKMGHTLNLASDISINLAVSKALLEGFDMDSVYVLAEIDIYDQSTKTGVNTLKILPAEQGNYYYFTIEGLTAVNMNDRIRSVLYGTKDGQVYYSPIDDYSIADYAYAQMNRAAVPESLKVLCADLLRYGAVAQIYKSYRSDILADSAMTAEHKALLSNTQTVCFGNTNTVLDDLPNASIKWEGRSLDLASKVAVKFIFSMGTYTGDLSELTLRVSYEDIYGNRKHLTVENGELYNADRGFYAFTLDALLVAELRSVLTVQIYAGQTPVSSTAQYSADSYGNNKTGTLLDLCKALFAYADSAKAFFAS